MTRFCLNPFKRLHLSLNGKAYFCCSSWIRYSLGDYFADGIPAIWNSMTSQKIRGSIHDGTFQFCDHTLCPRIVSGQVERETIPTRFEKIVEERSVCLGTGPEEISMNYDDSCNLFCSSCRQERKVSDSAASARAIRFQDEFLESSLFASARRLVITGVGEPFASRAYLDLLGKIDKQRNPDLRITLRSNGTLMTSDNWQRLANAHYAIDRISISIDAASEKTYQLLRRGGDFALLTRNLSLLAGIKNDYGFKLKLNFVVQKDNYNEMVEFLNLGIKMNCDKVAYTQLMNLGTYSPEEYALLAVHQPQHPEHSLFKAILNQPEFQHPIVSLRNLSHLIDKS